MDIHSYTETKSLGGKLKEKHVSEFFIRGNR